jgi:hypothetical protein
MRLREVARPNGVWRSSSTAPLGRRTGVTILNLKDETTTPSTAFSEDGVRRTLERIEELDARFGVGVGAAKERTRLNAIVDQWDDTEDLAASQQWRQDENDTDDEIDAQECSLDEFWDDGKFVKKHSPNDAVAIFGGDPKRRRQIVEKKLAPY